MYVMYVCVKVLAYRDLSPDGRPSEAARVLFDTLRWAEGVPGAQRVLLAAIPTPIHATGTGIPIPIEHPTGTASPSLSSMTSSGVSGSGDGDLRLGLADRVFRAASGVLVDIIVQR